MFDPIHTLVRAGLGLTLMGCALALPAFAAEQSSADDTAMPATEHQAESMRNVPDQAEGTRTGEQVPQTSDMPATKAQKEELKESGQMSHDKPMEDTPADTKEDATDSDTSEGATDQ
ncbi:hypothetical protein T35B1_15106 [Salinisphaera shabanensis T35B1]|uniref:hypothetical protein n=1 Tax=Salinisphaera shabanensis TaxID=180542 RepID=UPI003340D7BC